MCRWLPIKGIDPSCGWQSSLWLPWPLKVKEAQPCAANRDELA